MPSITSAPIARVDATADIGDAYLVSDSGFPNGRRAGDDVTDLTIYTLGNDPGDPNDATASANGASDPLTFALPYPDFDVNDGSYRTGVPALPTSTLAGDADVLSFESIVRAAMVTRDTGESVLDEVIDIVGMLAEPVPYSESDPAGTVADLPVALDPSDLKFGDGDAIL